MNNEADIVIRTYRAQCLKLQNELAYKDRLLEDCVSKQEYDLVVAERDAFEALHKSDQEALADAKAENDRLRVTIAEINDALAKATAAKFAPSSERMENLCGDGPELPLRDVEVLALLSHLKHQACKALGLDKEEAKEKEKEARPKALQNTNRRKPREEKGKRGVYTKEVFEILGLDTSNLSPKAKLIMRGGEGDTWTFRVLLATRMKIYSKEYTIGRFNVPGEFEPKNSAYPKGIHDKCHLSPSFVAFYLRMKISYNVSEQNIIRALRACGCDIPQATLNKYIQEVETVIREFLEESMIAEIKASLFTHNDETRLLVKCPDKKTGIIGYHNEYIHGILSPSAKLLLLLYKNGSREHDIQEEIFEGSSIECFTADKAKMYPKIVKDLRELKKEDISTTPVRGSCWVHWRRMAYELAMSDPRLKPLLKLIQILFKLEERYREDGLNADERLKKRQALSRPVVNAIVALLREVLSKGAEFGESVRSVALYLINDEEAFRAFLSHGIMEMDNNAIERCFRHIAMGRRTWLHTGSHKAATNLAFLYSLEESCKMNGLDFGDYIEYVLERIQDGDNDARLLLPNRLTIPQSWVPQGEIA